MSNRFKAISGEPNESTAIAHEFDTNNSFVTPGGKLISLKNAGVEKFSIDKDGTIRSQNVIVIKPEDGYDGFKTAVDTLGAAGGGVIQLTAGTFTWDTAVSPSFTWSNIIIQGMGHATHIEMVTHTPFYFRNGTSANSTVFSDTSIGDTSMFTTNPANAPNFNEGDTIRIFGTNVDTGESDAEMNIVLEDGNGSSGEVKLKYPLTRDITGITADAKKPHENIMLKDFRLTAKSTCIAVSGIIADGVRNIRAENIQIKAEDSSTNDGNIYFYACFKSSITHCTILNIQRVSSIKMTSCMESFVGYNKIFKATQSGNTSGINFSRGSYDNVIHGNKIISTEPTGGGHSIYIDDGLEGSGRTIISNNHLQRGNFSAILPSKECLIIGNIIDYSGQTAHPGAATIILVDRCAAIGNYLIQPYIGIQSNGTEKDVLVENNVILKSRGHAIGIYADRSIVRGNSIDGCVNGGIIGSGYSEGITIDSNTINDTTASAISIQGDCSHINISNNTIMGTNNQGIILQATQDVSGILFAKIMSNVIRDCTDTAIYIQGVKKSTVAHNVCLDNTTRALLVSDRGTAKSENIAIFQNIFRGETVSFTTTGTGIDFYDNKE